jgi:hypothetical protein
VHVAADQQNPFVLAALHQRVGEIETVQKARALLADVEGRDRLGEAHLRLQQRAVSGEVKVGRHRGEDDRVDVRGGLSRRGHRLFRGEHPQLRRPLPVIGVAALFDAAARADPLVGGIHHFGEDVVFDDVFRDADAGAGDDALHSEQ